MDKKNKGGNPPFGFRWYEGELIQAAKEASIYALVFELFLLYQRKSTVAKLLNERGLRTRAGKEFAFSTIKKLLTNPIAKGLRRSSYAEQDEDGKRSNVLHEESVQPIVSERVWDHVQAILIEQAGTQSRSPTQDVFIGKVICSCNTQMELPSKSSDYRCCSCDARIPINDVHAIVESQLESLTIPHPDELKKIATTSLKDINIDTEQQIKLLERDIAKLFSLHSKDAITDEIFRERHDPLQKRKLQLLTTFEDEKTSDSYGPLIECWHGLSPNLKRIAVENLIDNITVSADKVTVSLYPLFNFAQQVNTSPP